MSTPTPPPEPAPTSTAAMVLIAINRFGKDVALVLLFSAIIALAGRQIYRDLIASNASVIEMARVRSEQDKELTAALNALSKEIEGTNAIIAERVREQREEDRRNADRATSPNK